MIHDKFVVLVRYGGRTTPFDGAQKTKNMEREGETRRW